MNNQTDTTETAKILKPFTMTNMNKVGLRPAHQPKFPEYHPNSKRTNPHEEQRQKRLLNPLRKQIINIHQQTRRPNQTRNSKTLHSKQKRI